MQSDMHRETHKEAHILRFRKVLKQAFRVQETEYGQVLIQIALTLPGQKFCQIRIWIATLGSSLWYNMSG